MKKIINKLIDVWFIGLVVSGLSLSAMVRSGISYKYQLINLLVFMIFLILYNKI